MKPMLARDFINEVMNMPEGNNIIEGILPEGEVMLICGDPFRGKSLEAQRLACQFVKGGNYHGLQLTQCETAYITWEGANKGIAKRLTKLLNDIPVKQQPVIHKVDVKMSLNTKDGYSAFVTEINEIKVVRNVKVVIVDSFSYTIEGNASKDEVINKWWEAVQSLSKKMGITFIFIWEFTKPIIFRGEQQNMYDLSRLKTAYTTAYKVNTVVCIGEKDNRTSQRRFKTPQIVVMKAKDCGTLPPLDVEFNKDTYCFEGDYWKLDEDTEEYQAVKVITIGGEA